MTKMIRRQTPQVFIYTALPCEAKPIVQSLGLKKAMDVSVYEVFLNSDICLVVTGCGKSAMAAAIAYSQAWFKPRSLPVLLNVGIAGHPAHPLSSVFLIAKALDADSGKSHYPPLVFTPPCPTESLQTAAKPQRDYRLPYLYDMEATAFFETAGRFSSSELAQSLKVVSDNKTQPADTINAKQVSELIAVNISVINDTLAELLAVRARLPVQEPQQFQQLLQYYRLTASQQQQLEHLLRRLQLLTGDSQPAIDPSIANGRDLLRWLENRVGQLPVVL